MSNLASGALKARSLHPWLQPRIAFSRCLPPPPCSAPTPATWHTGEAQLAPARRATTAGLRSSYPVVAAARPAPLQRFATRTPPMVGFQRQSLAPPAVLTRPSPHLIAAQHRSLLRFPVRRRCARARLRLGRHHRRRASRPSTGWVRARRCRIEAAPSMTGKSWRIEAALNAGDSPGSQGGSHRRSTQLFFLVPPVLPGSTDVLPAHKRIRDPHAPQPSGYHRP